MSRTTRTLALALILGVTAACSGGASTSGSSSAAADSTQDGAGEKGVLKVAGTGVSYPHSFTEDGELVGFETDVIREAAERAGYTVEFSTMDFPGLLPAIAAGRIDTGGSNITWTPERSETYVFSAAYAFDGVALATRADNEEIQELADFNGATISTGAGTTNEAAVTAWVEETGYDVNLRSYETADAAMQELLVGRADGMAGPGGASIARGELNGVPLKLVGELLTYEQSRLAFANTEEGRQKAEDLSASIIEMREDGTIAELSNKYFSYDRSQPTNAAHEEPAIDQITTPEDAA